MSLFPSIFSAFSLYGEYVVRTFSPSQWCFFYLVTTGWIFYISLCENSINQSIILKNSAQYPQRTIPLKIVHMAGT